MMRQENHRLLRRLCLVTVALILGAAGSSVIHAQSYWFENYERAIALIDAGQVAQASTLLERVIADHPLPVACLRVPGDRCIDYVPYVQRARIQIYQGDTRGASHSLDVSEAFGTGLANRRTDREVQKLRQQIQMMDATRRSSSSATVAPAADAH